MSMSFLLVGTRSSSQSKIKAPKAGRDTPGHELVQHPTPRSGPGGRVKARYEENPITSTVRITKHLDENAGKNANSKNIQCQSKSGSNWLKHITSAQPRHKAVLLPQILQQIQGSRTTPTATFQQDLLCWFFYCHSRNQKRTCWNHPVGPSRPLSWKWNPDLISSKFKCK